MTLNEFLKLVYSIDNDIEAFKAWLTASSHGHSDRTLDAWWSLWAKYVDNIYKQKGF